MFLVIYQCNRCKEINASNNNNNKNYTFCRGIFEYVQCNTASESNPEAGTKSSFAAEMSSQANEEFVAWCRFLATNINSQAKN